MTIITVFGDGLYETVLINQSLAPNPLSNRQRKKRRGKKNKRQQQHQGINIDDIIAQYGREKALRYLRCIYPSQRDEARPYFQSYIRHHIMDEYKSKFDIESIMIDEPSGQFYFTYNESTTFETTLQRDYLSGLCVKARGTDDCCNGAAPDDLFIPPLYIQGNEHHDYGVSCLDEKIMRRFFEVHSWSFRDRSRMDLDGGLRPCCRPSNAHLVLRPIEMFQRRSQRFHDTELREETTRMSDLDYDAMDEFLVNQGLEHAYDDARAPDMDLAVAMQKESRYLCEQTDHTGNIPALDVFYEIMDVDKIYDGKSGEFRATYTIKESRGVVFDVPIKDIIRYTKEAQTAYKDFSMDEIIIFDEYAYVDHGMYETVIRPSVPTGSVVKHQRAQLQQQKKMTQQSRHQLQGHRDTRSARQFAQKTPLHRGKRSYR